MNEFTKVYTLPELKEISRSGIKVLIPGHTTLISVTDDLIGEQGLLGYKLLSKMDGVNVFQNVYHPE